MKEVVGRVDGWLTRLEEWTLFLAVMGALAALFFGVVLRYGANHALAWSEELVRLVIIYTTFVGCSRAIRSGSMVRIDALVQLVPWLRRPLFLVSQVATLCFAGVLLVKGWEMVLLQMSTGQKTIIMQIPMALVYGILPLSGVLMGFRALGHLVCDGLENVAEEGR